MFSLTILKTWNARRDHAVTGINIPLISLILRDGMFLYSIILCSTKLNIMHLGAVYFA